MADELDFWHMTEEQMKQFAEENPTRVNDRDKDGRTLLLAATNEGRADLVTWLIDEKGACVHGTTESPLHSAHSPDMLSLLLVRGADVTALDDWGWTPLMRNAYFSYPDCVERLLKESRVIETVETQATDGRDSYPRGSTALHLACTSEYRTPEGRNQILEMLLCAGANPTILDVGRDTPLDILHRSDFHNPTAIALLERALIEPQRSLILAKAREINDANHAVAKAKEEAQRKVLASAPTFLQGRIRKQQQQQQQQQQGLLVGPPLPRVELHHGLSASDNDNEKEEETAKMRHATLQYVLRAPELGEMGGMSADVFVELMEMITPRWDPIRRRDGGGGGGSGSGGDGGTGGVG